MLFRTVRLVWHIPRATVDPFQTAFSECGPRSPELSNPENVGTTGTPEQGDKRGR